MKIYGYCRVSTMSQNLERQLKNIKAVYPDAIIITDEYTGTKMDRPAWSKLYSRLKSGDVVVFDSVSRMSRNADEGIEQYMKLFDMGVTLIFLKEPYINTSVYASKLRQADVSTGKAYLDEGLKVILMGLAMEQIRIAFDQSEKEVQDLRQRVSEGIAVAKLNGKQVGRSEGDKLTVKKSQPIKALIRKYSRDFDGHNSDTEVLSILSSKTVDIPVKKKSGAVEMRTISAKLARNTYYRYKAEMKAEVL